MNILSINKFYWLKGGCETVFFNEKKLLESYGHKVVPFSMKMEQNIPSKYSSYFVEEIKYDDCGSVLNKLNEAFKIIYSFDARKKIESLLKAYSPDIAHFHNFQHQISPSVFAPLIKLNIPIVLTIHDLKLMCPNYKMYVNGHICEKCKGQRFYYCFLNSCTKGSMAKSMVNTLEMYWHYMMRYYQRVDKYIVVSRFYRNKMIEYGFPEEKIFYIPNYIDSSKYSPSYNDKGYAVIAGRLSYEKGVETVIKAAKLCPDIPVKIVGSGPEDLSLKALVDMEKVGNVEFMGYKTGDELTRLIADASFSIIASVWYENCPMSVLESFALGKAVIGSDIGGIPELIHEGVDGLLFAPGDEASLASKMQSLWESPEIRKEMGIQGREKVAINFSPERHYVDLMSAYSSAIQIKKT